MNTDTMKCMNCPTEVAPKDAKFFAKVFLCPSCYEQAQHFYTKLDIELRHLLVVAKEAIRIALVTGKFSFPEGMGGEVSKRAVLEAIMKFEEAREAQNKPT